MANRKYINSKTNLNVHVSKTGPLGPAGDITNRELSRISKWCVMNWVLSNSSSRSSPKQASKPASIGILGGETGNELDGRQSS